MGCVQTKPSMGSPPRGLQKLKLESGYFGKSELDGPRRSTDQRSGFDGPRRSSSQRSGIDGPRRSTGQRSGFEGPRRSNSQISGSDGPRRSIDQRHPHRESSRRYEDEPRLNNGNVGADEKLLGKEAEDEERNVGNLSKRLSIGEDELVDGWPKWLTDNIPRRALAGLVPKSAESYDKLDKVGQGTYSNVYKARDRETGKIVALKKVRFDTSEPESVKFMAREIMILQKLDHPNIVKLEGLATSRMQYSLYLVFEFMQSDLARIISLPEGLAEPQVKCYMHQLLSGLQHCHDRGILHRDIKSSNLLIDKNGTLKIADFGLANYYNHKRPLTNRVVTLWYRSPELLLGATNYGVGIDLWSAGCLLAEMFLGRPIMPGRTEVEQLHRIFKLCGTPSEEYWKKLKLSTTFRPPKSYKPSLQEAFRDFPRSSLGLLNILLALYPAYRGSASSALQHEFFFTSPLACDLSDLPVVYNEDDELDQANEWRKYKNSKMKRRSHTQREHRRKNVSPVKLEDHATCKEEMEKTADRNTQTEESSSTTSSTSSSVLLARQDESPYFSLSPVIPSSQKTSQKSQGYPNGSNEDKNLPPLPKSKSRIMGYKGNNVYRVNLVSRSTSSREFRNLDYMEHL